MALTYEEKKQKIINALTKGQTMAEIARAYNVSVGMVAGIRQEMQKAQAAAPAATPDTLSDIVDNLEDKGFSDIAAKTKKLARNIDILQQFYPELIEAARLLLAKVVEKLTGPELSLSELRQTVEIIERLNSSFFNQQVTQTLIQINNTEVNNKVNNKMTLVQEREARLAQLKSSIEDQQPILMKEAQHADKPES